MKKSSNAFVIAILLIPFFDPSILTQEGMPMWIDWVIKAFQIIGILVSFFLIRPVLAHHKHEITHAIPVIVLFTWLLLITGLKGYDILKPLLFILQVFAVCTICAYYIFCKNDLKTLSKVLSSYYGVLMVLDIITLLLFPQNQLFWIFGAKNNHIHHVLLYSFFSIMRIMSYDRLSFKHLIIPLSLSLTDLILEQSTTAILAYAISLLGIFFCYLFYNHKRNKSIVKPKVFFLVTLIISGLIVVFEQFNALELVVAYFDKEDTFGRIGIWENAMYYIRQSPYVGNGFEPMKIINVKFDFEFTQCHNKYVDILYMGGAIGLILFVLAIFIQLSKAKVSFGQQLLALVLCAYSIEFITEGQRLNLILYLMLFLYPIISNLYESGKRCSLM